jgi:hypothetical protein
MMVLGMTAVLQASTRCQRAETVIDTFDHAASLWTARWAAKSSATSAVSLTAEGDVVTMASKASPADAASTIKHVRCSFA